MKIDYEIQLYSYWCSSTGSAEKDADSIPVLDDQELALMPGKSVKGLLRAACRQLDKAPEDSRYDFKSKHNKLNYQTVFGTESTLTDSTLTEGLVNVPSAVLSDPLKSLLNDDRDLKQDLFQTVRSTAMTKKNVAKEKSLRSIQCVIPLSLYGQISIGEGPDDLTAELVREYLLAGFTLIRKLGLGRHRGFGRCQVREVKHVD